MQSCFRGAVPVSQAHVGATSVGDGEQCGCVRLDSESPDQRHEPSLVCRMYGVTSFVFMRVFSTFVGLIMVNN
jgi:hypothetical protein